jgi:hypothetical protein
VQALARALVCVAIPVAVLLSRDAKIGRPADEASSQQLAHITEQAALVPAGNIEGPLGMSHGWPGSILELLKTVGPITDPTAHGGRAEDAFDLLSFSGYGFSGIPPGTGWVWGRVGRACGKLMGRLGYERYVAQGCDELASDHQLIVAATSWP